MADQAHEVDMTVVEKMDSARNVLSAAATMFMARGGLPESGIGTVSTDEKGVQHVVGVNAGFSRITFSEQPTRTVNGLETVDDNKWAKGDGGVVHKNTKDAANSKSSTDEISRILGDGTVAVDLKGTCSVDDKGTEKCKYNLTSPSGNGTAEITTTKETIDEKWHIWGAKSQIDVRTNNGNVSAELVYKVSNDVASYEYKNISSQVAEREAKEIKAEAKQIASIVKGSGNVRDAAEDPQVQKMLAAAKDSNQLDNLIKATNSALENKNGKVGFKFEANEFFGVLLRKVDKADNTITSDDPRFAGPMSEKQLDAAAIKIAHVVSTTGTMGDQAVKHEINQIFGRSLKNHQEDKLLEKINGDNLGDADITGTHQYIIKQAMGVNPRGNNMTKFTLINDDVALVPVMLIPLRIRDFPNRSQ
jgi:hypothetical protein